MTNNTKIDWTGKVWQPMTGCSPVSPACEKCYARVQALRLKGMGTKGYENGFEITLHSERLEQPLKISRPSRFFVCSMGDLFHEQCPDDYLDQVMEVIRRCPQHTFQILTKRAERMEGYFSERPVPENAWIGVTVEDRTHGLPRIDHLRAINAQIRFLSIEPLLEDLGQFSLDGIHWVIVGGEKARGARRMHADWVRGVRDLCQEAGVAFFFKQWGNFGESGQWQRSAKMNGFLLDGVQYRQYPDDPRIEHPQQPGMTIRRLRPADIFEAPAENCSEGGECLAAGRDGFVSSQNGYVTDKTGLYKVQGDDRRFLCGPLAGC